MSLDIEERLREFLASAPQNIHEIQVVSISHSDMTQAYHLWAEPYDGQVTTEGDVVLDVMGVNMEIKRAGSHPNLDQAFDISLDTVDADDTFRKEMDLIPLGTEEKIVVVYREYLSDDLTEPQAVAVLEAEGVTYTRGFASISAIVPKCNITRTGELYTLKRIPMLRGFL